MCQYTLPVWTFKEQISALFLTFMSLMFSFGSCTLSWAFSVVRGVSGWISVSAPENVAGKSHTFTVQSWLPVATNDAFILETHTDTDCLNTFSIKLSEACVTWTDVRLWDWGRSPGAADGAHGVGVTGALGHTSHQAAVTVHLPHTHWPVLETDTCWLNGLVVL